MTCFKPRNRAWKPVLLLSFAVFLPHTQGHAQSALDTFSDAMSDGSNGPEMVVIPGSQFLMGDRHGNGPDDEKPNREVELGPFAMSRYEVTSEEFAHFVKAFSKRPPKGNENSGAYHPVTHISWDDAQGYVHWLSQETGQNYRLPTEAQWEFAARGGSSTTFFWGNDPSQACFYANVADQAALRQDEKWLSVSCEDGFTGPAPVGQFPPNPYGLYDMIGNVWEWVEDCYSDNYKALPQDGRALENAYCRKRVSRGGAWSSPPWYLRTSHRQPQPPNGRRENLGFRIVRALDEAEINRLAQR